MSKENITKYFDMLGELYLKHPEWERRPQLIFNLDETCLQCDKTNGKVYTNVCRKNAYKVVSDGTKKSFTLLVCCNAAGSFHMKMDNLNKIPQTTPSNYPEIKHRFSSINIMKKSQILGLYL